MNILLVEDNRMNQKYGKILLDELGHNCSIAINGLEALVKVKAEKFDVILMDIQMPEMDGYEATKIIRNQLKISTPIIAITANALAGEKRRCLNLGMNGYVSKPFLPEKLQKTIYEVSTNKSGLENGSIAINRTLINPSKDRVLDLEFLFSQVNRKVEGVIELIEIFKVDNPVALAELKKAIIKEDFDHISKIAHNLVSSFSILGIQSAIEILKSIELNSNNLKQIEVIGHWFRQFEQICIILEKEILDFNVAGNTMEMSQYKK